jgi:hypothetical protein
MLTSWCCAHSHVVLLYLIGTLKEGQVIHASSNQPGVTDIGVHMKRFYWLRNDSRDFTLMITVFLRTHSSSFCSCEHLSFSGLDIITHGHYRRVNFFTLSSHSTQNCRWLRSGSLVEFTVSAYWDDVHVAVFTGLSNTVGFLWFEQLIFTEGQVLAGEFRLSSRWYTDTQTCTLPLFVTSLMCIMTLWQFLSLEPLYVVHYVCAHNCLLCVWIFLQPDERIIFRCRWEWCTWRYY